MAGNSRKKSGRARSWIVCALAAASLWRGPVPWIHSHETLEAQGLPEAALAWHVQHLHPQESENSIFGWHVHLSYPWEVSNEATPPREPDSPKPRATYDMPYVVSPASSTVDVDDHADQSVASLPTAMHSVVASLECGHVLCGQFTPTPTPSVSLRALFCVVQC
jgi:hypothetical protein